MEVNDFLPRSEGLGRPCKAEPDIREALNVDLGLDKDRIYEYPGSNTEGLYNICLLANAMR